MTHQLKVAPRDDFVEPLYDEQLEPVPLTGTPVVSPLAVVRVVEGDGCQLAIADDIGNLRNVSARHRQLRRECCSEMATVSHTFTVSCTVK